METLGPEIFKGFKQDYVPTPEEADFRDALTSLAVEAAIELGIQALQDDIQQREDARIWNFIALISPVPSGRNEIEVGLLSGPTFDDDEILANIVVRKK